MILQKKSWEIKIVEILFYCLPLSFIVGNLFVSLNSILFILFSLFLINKKKLKYKFEYSHWILIVFFLYLLVLTTVQFLSSEVLNDYMSSLSLENNPIFKSFLLIRFFILIFILSILFNNKILNFKNFFLISLLGTTFVSFDIIFQYLSGSDIFGYKSFKEINSGPFGSEFIAGSFLQKFSFYSFFYVFIFIDKKYFKNPLLIFLISLHLIAALLAGNKMPTILFLLGCILTFVLVKKIRLSMFFSLIIFLTTYIFIFNNDSHIRELHKGFFAEITFSELLKENNSLKKENNENETKNESIVEKDKKIKFLRGSMYGPIFRTAYYTWSENPIFGFGLKSFRVKCWEVGPKLGVGESKNLSCATHPHNYYLELLVEAGIIGTFLMICFFLIVIKNSLYFIIKYIRTKNADMILFIPMIILFTLEVWPIRSTGSFFTTWNATFFWLNISMLFVALNKSSTIFSEINPINFGRK